MTLSDHEMKIIANIPKNRRNRRLGLWLTTASIPMLIAAGAYIDYDLTTAITFLGGFLGGQAAAHSSSRVEDKLIDLVQRYVNSDPEAMFAGRDHAGEGAV